jgi:hypothetical protein
MNVMASSKSYSISAAPNQSLVRGTIIALRPESGGYGQTVELKVAESQNIDDLPNFTRTAVGQILPFYLSETNVALHPGDRIEAKATYRGGPSGGRYSLLPDDIKKI